MMLPGNDRDPPGEETAEATPSRRRFRALTPRNALIMLYATAVAPVIAAAFGSGVPVAEAAAVAQLVGSVGAGAVSIGLADAVARLGRARGAGADLTTADVQTQVADSLDRTLPADGGSPALDFEIATALQQVNGASAIMTALQDQDDERGLADLVTALSSMGASFPMTLDVLRGGMAQVLQNQALLDQKSREMLVLQARMQRDLDELVVRGTEDTSWPPTAGQGECPYLGLKSFGERDSAVFYGREDLTAELTDWLTGLQYKGILIVTGASGAGKTSLLHAGLLPTLERGEQVPGSDRWPRYALIPSADPLSQFAQILASLGGDDPEQIAERLTAVPEAANVVVRQALDRYALRSGWTAGYGRLILVIDQFEIFFDLDLDEGQTRAYLTVLQSAACPTEPDGPPPAAIALAIRSDRYDECIDDPVLSDVVKARPAFPVTPMDDDGLRRAIIRPAKKAGRDIEDGLVEDILDDVAGVPRDGVLPLLSEAMRVTWSKSTGNQLTRDGYRKGGGVRGAVREGADTVYRGLSLDQQKLAQDILISMTEIRNEHHIRRPTTLLRIGAAHPGEEAAVNAVLDALRAARLIVIGTDVQIVHDVLLEAWPRLKDWISEDLRNFTAHRQFQDDAYLWADHGEQRDFLYQGIRLAALTEAMTRWPGDRYSLTVAERRFLTASKRAGGRRTFQRRLLAGTVALLTVVSAVAAVVASQADATANRQRQAALAGQFALTSEALDPVEPIDAALLAAAAWEEDSNSQQARVSMLEISAQPVRAVFTGTGGSPINAAAFSPRGDLLATAGKTIVLWNTATNRPVGAPVNVPGGAAALAFNNSGSIVVTGDNDGTARMWNVSTGREIGQPIRTGSGPVNAVAFSPDGDLLATADSDGTARLWNTGTGREFGHALIDGGQVLPAEPVTDVAFSPDGKLLATASRDGTARLWDVSSQRQFGRAMANKGVIASNLPMVATAFSPDGNVLATADRGGTLSLWNVATQQLDGPQMTAEASANDLAFSPDGRSLAVADEVGTAEIWDVATRTLKSPLYPAYLAGMMSAVAFSPSATMLATVTSDGTAWLWDLSSFSTVTPPANVGTGEAISLDARTVAGVDRDRTVRLWNLESGRVEVTIPASDTGGVDAVALSPDGQILATGGDDGMAQLWNAQTGQPIGKAITVSTTGAVSALAFSPDGQTLATGDDNGIVRLWNIATGRARQQVPGVPSAVKSLTFSPNGTLLAVTYTSLELRLWDTATHKLSGTHISLAVEGAAFSPQSTMLATADKDGTARLWNLTTGQQIGAPILATDLGAVETAAFSPDGTLLATGADDGDAAVWDVEYRNRIGPALGGFSLYTAMTMVAFSPDGSFLTTVDASGNAERWNVSLPPSPDLYKAVCLLAGRSLTHQEWASYISPALYVDGCPQTPGT
jgi:WD40 repeat protein